MDLMALVSDKNKKAHSRGGGVLIIEGGKNLILDIPNMKTNSLIPPVDGR